MIDRYTRQSGEKKRAKEEDLNKQRRLLSAEVYVHGFEIGGELI